MKDALTAALRDLASGDDESAKARLAQVDAAGNSLLAAELARYLAGPGLDSVYDGGEAFRDFISGGGNVRLYRGVVERLAQRYRDQAATTVVDLGCGDGRAVLAAAERAGTALSLELVEPSADLLGVAVAGAADRGLTVTAHSGTAQEFVAGIADPATSWDIAQATFALSALPAAQRATVLRGLRPYVNRLVIIEFDVPRLDETSDDYLAHLVDRYEIGVAEYSNGNHRVAQGFLIPLLLGLVAPGQRRGVWEAPAGDWAELLRREGYREVAIAKVEDYWWAPAFEVTGLGGRA